MADYKLISSDSHIVEPLDLWTERIAPNSRTRRRTWPMKVIPTSGTLTGT